MQRFVEALLHHKEVNLAKKDKNEKIKTKLDEKIFPLRHNMR